MAKLTDLSINDTGALVLPDGSGKDRPGYTIKVFTEGSGTLAIPTGVTEVDVLVVAGGGGSAGIGGGGGGGGMIERPGYPVTPGGTVPYSVGAGGLTGGNYPGPAGSNGDNSVFGGLTAVGGGGAGSWNSSTPSPGGSGSGGVGSPSTGRDGGTGIQPSQPGDSGTYGYGYPGARGGTNPASNSTTGAGRYTGGGGGGAGGAGGHPSRTGPGDTSQDGVAGRQGGAGRSSSITGVPVFYAGGGGGGSHSDGYQSPVTTAEGGIGGGGRGGSIDWMYDQMGIQNFRKDVGNHSRTLGGHNNRWQYTGHGMGEPGRRNSGGGGGGGYYTAGGTGAGGTGGSGIIIVKYRNPVQTVTISDITESTILTCSSNHNAQTDEVLVPTTSGNGLTTGSKYYIVEILSSTQFKVSTSKGGNALQLTNGSSLNIAATVFTAEAEQGMTRFNNEEGHLEIYDGDRWRPLKRTVVQFTQTGMHHFKVPEGVTNVDVLVVGGGGSGGELGGGGGAGGLIYEQNVPVAPGGVVPIHVGSGGWHEMTHRSEHGIRKGQPSWFGGYEAYGGGAGASHPAAARSQPATHNWWDDWSDSGGNASMGGSGGGSMYNQPGNWAYGTPGQGNRGGGNPGGPGHGNGGGGGAGGRGLDGRPGDVGTGGVGREIFITGGPVHYAGGGGGGSHGPQAAAGDGGTGGGGGGGRYNQWPSVGALEASHRASAGDYAAPGKDNTGGGGGGSGHNQSNPYGVGGKGGPGVVIVRY